MRGPMDGVEDAFLKILNDGHSVVFCSGGGDAWKHDSIPVVLFLRRTKRVRRGVCPKCGTAYVSMTEMEVEK